eukprot:4760064-Pyramimonas_sp.AAC.1
MCVTRKAGVCFVLLTLLMRLTVFEVLSDSTTGGHKPAFMAKSVADVSAGSSGKGGRDSDRN